jgi:hypothetical protein
VKHIKDFDEEFREKMKNMTLMQRLNSGAADLELGTSNYSSRIEYDREEAKFEDAATNRSSSRLAIKNRALP